MNKVSLARKLDEQLSKERVHLILLSSEKDKKVIDHFARFISRDKILLIDPKLLKEAMGKDDIKAISIEDINLANAIIETYKEEERYEQIQEQQTEQ